MDSQTILYGNMAYYARGDDKKSENSPMKPTRNANAELRKIVRTSGQDASSIAVKLGFNKNTFLSWVSGTNRFNPAHNLKHQEVLREVVYFLNLDETVFNSVMEASRLDEEPTMGAVAESTATYSIDASIVPALLDILESPSASRESKTSARTAILRMLNIF